MEESEGESDPEPTSECVKSSGEEIVRDSSGVERRPDCASASDSDECDEAEYECDCRPCG